MTVHGYKYGEVIKRHRVEMGMTQREVADGCGITDSALAHIERELRLPSKPVARRIAKVLQFSPEVCAKFNEGLKKARKRQAENRVRSRAAVKPILGHDAPDAEELARELIADDALLEGYRYLKKALRKPGQRKVVLRALKAWASER